MKRVKITTLIAVMCIMTAACGQKNNNSLDIVVSDEVQISEENIAKDPVLKEDVIEETLKEYNSSDGTLEYAYEYLLNYINGTEYIPETFNSALAYSADQDYNGVFILFDCNDDGIDEVFATGGDTWACVSVREYLRIGYYDPETGRMAWFYAGGASSQYYGYVFYDFNGKNFTEAEKWVSEEDFADDEFVSVRKLHIVDGVESEISDEEFEAGMKKISERLISLADMDNIHEINLLNIEEYLK